jgi:hypothetical protein
MARIFLCIAVSCSLLIAARPSPATATDNRPAIVRRWSALTPAAWRADLRYFVATAEQRHRYLFHAMTRTQFDRAVRQFDAQISTSSPEGSFDGFIRLTAMIQDSHSGVAITDMGLPQVPARFVQYGSDVYVEGAGAKDAAIAGGRVLSVGGVPMSDALNPLLPLVPRDAGNPGQPVVWAARSYLNVPIILRGVGLSSSSSSATYVIEKDGKPQTVTLTAAAPGQFSLRDFVLDPLPAGWVSAQAQHSVVPLAEQHPDSFYFFTPVPEHVAVYVCVRGMIDDPAQSLQAFSQALYEYLVSHPTERVIVDLRENSGGDNTLIRPLLLALIRSPQNYRGGLWVLISPVTHSAAQSFVDRLENFSDPIFVGEPTGEPVNFYGDPTEITLPNSGIPVALSTLWWQDKDPRDARRATYPEIASSLTFSDYVAGQDPTLGLALSLPIPPTLGDVLGQASLFAMDAVVRAYRSYMDDPHHRFVLDAERQVNAAGYQLLGQNAPTRAVTIFRLNVIERPRSSNAYDSLADGLEAIGDTRDATAARQRSVALKRTGAAAVGDAPR